MIQIAPRETPIADHGAIGNLRTVALVGLDGAIDWLCLPYLDGPSVFASILDRRRGGRFAVAPAHIHRRSQRYLPGTNALETAFEADGGTLVVTDFMPLCGDLRGTGAGSEAEPAVVRILRASGDGDGPGVLVEVEWWPRLDYARGPTRIARADGGFLAEGPGGRLALAGLPPDAEAEVVEAPDGGPAVSARFRLGGGRSVALVTRWVEGEGEGVGEADPGRAGTALRRTVEAWRDWLHAERVEGRDWAGDRAGLVVRSELVLKLLMQAGTGALAAAATTSLPEAIGGVRNWDYRFAWVRDAALVARALSAVGHREEMRAFVHWADDACRRQGGDAGELRVLYGLRGPVDMAETTLDHLAGHLDSRPVRIGNGAAEQVQHDLYGDLLSAAVELARFEDLGPDTREFLREAVDAIVRAWPKPDSGIWEMRSGPHEFVFSRVKAWEAVDRGLVLADRHGLEGDLPRWRRARDQIRAEVLERGYDAGLGAFVMAYDKRVLDAANLRIPLLGFLPPDDPRVRSTIDRTLEHLTDRGLVYRYKADDGLPGEEGAFVLCTFWMVDALARTGRLDEARAMFEGTARRANHLGLFAEQIDPASGRFLGNFPQAYSHMALIHSVLNLAAAEGRALPVAGHGPSGR